MAKPSAFFGFAALSALLAVTACSGSGNSKPTRDLALVRACFGQYRCVFTALEQTMPNEDSVRVELAPSASSTVCGAEQLFSLYPDGSAVFDAAFQEPPSTWTGDRNQFQTCFGDSKLGCIDCYLLDSTSTSSPSAATNSRCTGDADDCESEGSTCNGQGGCFGLGFAARPGRHREKSTRFAAARARITQFSRPMWGAPRSAKTTARP